MIPKLKGEHKARSLVKQGLAIGAIKHLRDKNPGLSLKEAKDVVVSWQPKPSVPMFAGPVPVLTDAEVNSLLDKIVGVLRHQAKETGDTKTLSELEVPIEALRARIIASRQRLTTDTRDFFLPTHLSRHNRNFAL